MKSHIAKVEDLCLALAQLADEAKVSADDDENDQCTIVFTVPSDHLEAALARVRGG